MFSLCAEEGIMDVLLIIRNSQLLFHVMILSFRNPWRCVDAFRADQRVFICGKTLHGVLVRQPNRIFVVLNKWRLVLNHNKTLGLLDLSLLKLVKLCFYSHRRCEASNR